MVRKIDKEWLLEQIALVFKYSEDLVELSDERGPAYNSKTVLKLAKLAAAIDIYTPIISNQNLEFHYIDALAGAGVTKLKQPGKYIVGSPILVPAVAHEQFDMYHFIERDTDRAKALEKRLEFVSENTRIDLDADQWKVYPEKAETVIPDLMEKLEKRRHSNSCPGVNLFRFVDNEGRTVDWSTIQAMARIWGDFLITFSPRFFPRDVANIEVEDSNRRFENITAFFGTSEWEKCEKPEEFAELYEDRLKSVGYEKYTVRTRVRGAPETRGAYYDVIWATRKTANNSPYRDGIEHIRNRIERNHGGIVNDFLDRFVYGNQTSFDLYDSEGDVGQHGFEDFM